MVEIKICVETEDGKEHTSESKSGHLSVLLAKLPYKLNKLVKSVERNGKKVIRQQVCFVGDWNFIVLNRFTKGLEKRGIEWKWEL